jgi:hypothetical protein
LEEEMPIEMKKKLIVYFDQHEAFTCEVSATLPIFELKKLVMEHFELETGPLDLMKYALYIDDVRLPDNFSLQYIIYDGVDMFLRSASEASKMEE